MRGRKGSRGIAHCCCSSRGIAHCRCAGGGCPTGIRARGIHSAIREVNNSGTARRTLLVSLGVYCVEVRVRHLSQGGEEGAGALAQKLPTTS